MIPGLADLAHSLSRLDIEEQEEVLTDIEQRLRELFAAIEPGAPAVNSQRCAARVVAALRARLIEWERPVRAPR